MTEVFRIVRLACATAAVGLAMAVPASAGHDEVQEDPAIVADRLHHMGFVEWRKLRWDHGYWKVDDARRVNGHVYDLKLEAGSFDLVRLTREHD
jgi:hypothetical protein